MDCAAAQDVLSARLDGQAAPAELAALNSHLARCVACRRFGDRLDRLHRSLRVRPAEAVPDLSGPILARAHPPTPGRGEWIRWALLAVALVELTLALPSLVLGDDPGASVHVARHLGSFSIALAIGMVYVAARPERAYGLLPVALSLVACTAVTAVLDIADGNVAALGEAHHVLEIGALVLLWMLAGRPRPRLHHGERRERHPLFASVLPH